MISFCELKLVILSDGKPKSPKMVKKPYLLKAFS